MHVLLSEEEKQRQAGAKLFAGLSEAEVRELVVEALRLRCSQAPRGRRNDVSHTTPRYDFGDPEEVEELLVSASRELPNLWPVVTGP